MDRIEWELLILKTAKFSLLLNGIQECVFMMMFVVGILIRTLEQVNFI